MCGKSSRTCKISPAKFRRRNNNWHNSWRLTGAAQEILPKKYCSRKTYLIYIDEWCTQWKTNTSKNVSRLDTCTPSDSLCSVVGHPHVQLCIASAFRTGRPTDFRFMNVSTPLQRLSSEVGEVGGWGKSRGREAGERGEGGANKKMRVDVREKRHSWWGSFTLTPTSEGAIRVSFTRRMGRCEEEWGGRWRGGGWEEEEEGEEEGGRVEPSLPSSPLLDSPFSKLLRFTYRVTNCSWSPAGISAPFPSQHVRLVSPPPPNPHLPRPAPSYASPRLHHHPWSQPPPPPQCPPLFPSHLSVLIYPRNKASEMKRLCGVTSTSLIKSLDARLVQRVRCLDGRQKHSQTSRGVRGRQKAAWAVSLSPNGLRHPVFAFKMPTWQQQLFLPHGVALWTIFRRSNFIWSKETATLVL